MSQDNAETSPDQTSPDQASQASQAYIRPLIHYPICLSDDGKIAVQRIAKGKHKGDWLTVGSAGCPLIFRIVQDTDNTYRTIYAHYNDEYYPDLHKLGWLFIHRHKLVFRGPTPRNWITENYDALVQAMYQGIPPGTVLPKSTWRENEAKIAELQKIEMLQREMQKQLDLIASLEKAQKDLQEKKLRLQQLREKQTQKVEKGNE